jgi:hypothetical protein
MNDVKINAKFIGFSTFISIKRKIDLAFSQNRLPTQGSRIFATAQRFRSSIG